jgi:uncharacterized protein
MMATEPQSPDTKLQRLREIIRSCESALVAFSGGVDSTFLLKIAHEELGDNVVGVTARSETYPAREYREALDFASKAGIRHMTIETSELALPAFRHNPPDRCYYCKQELFGRLTDMARGLGLKQVMDGANADDRGDFRPGSRAAKELGVRSPLQEAGLTKDEIRLLSRRMGLPTWDKPSFACLSSRFPYGEEISKEAVARVAAAEEFLREMGFRQVRVRHHGNTARIELDPSEIPEILGEDRRRQVVERFKELGYSYVTLDLEGYRTGSMNEVLTDEQKDR